MYFKKRVGKVIKKHWNTVILDGTVPEEDIKRMIAENYDLVMK